MRRTERYEFISQKAKSNNLSLSTLAEICHIGRTTLYRIMRGESLPDETLLTMLSKHLRLSPAEETRLSALMLGAEGQNCFGAAFDLLDGVFFSTKESDRKSKSSSAHAILFSFDGKRLMTLDELSDEVAEKMIPRRDVTVYSFLMSDTAGDFVERFAVRSDAARTFRMTHYITIQDDDPVACVETLAEIVRFGRFEDCDFYATAGGEMPDVPANTVVVDSVDENGAQLLVITIVADGISGALLTRDTAARAYYLAVLERIKGHFQSLIIKEKNLNAFNDTVKTIETGSRFCLMQDDMCPNLIPWRLIKEGMDAVGDEMLCSLLGAVFNRAIAPFEIRYYAEMLLEGMKERYEKLLNKQDYFVFSRASIEHFARTGEMLGIVFSKEQRVEIFRDILSRMRRKGNELKLYINPQKLLADGISVLVSLKYGLEIDYLGAAKNLHVVENIYIVHPAICKLMFRYVTEHLPIKYLWSPQKTMLFLEDIIEKI